MEKKCNNCTSFSCFKKNIDSVEKKKFYDRKSKKLFIGLSWISVFLIMSIAFVLSYLIYPRLHSISKILTDILGIGILLFIVVIVGGLGLISLTVIFEKDLLYPHGEKSVTIKLLYPLDFLLAKLFRIGRTDLGNSFVEVNNAMIRALAKEGRINPKRILILLPHCIQYHDCQLRVTNDISHCAECGKCDIAGILELKKKYNIKNVNIATGGTLARKIIIDTRPTFIIAVACERDLVDGVKDAYPIMVYGVLNIRYNGACYDTIVPLDELEKALVFAMGLKK